MTIFERAKIRLRLEKEQPSLTYKEIEQEVRREYYAEVNAEKRSQEEPPY